MYMALLTWQFMPQYKTNREELAIRHRTARHFLLPEKYAIVSKLI